MRKVVEYTVENLSDVKTALDNGYQPFGNPLSKITSVNGKDGTPHYEVLQAMVKYEEELPEQQVPNAIDRPVRLTIFPSGAEELSVFLTPGREPIQFIRANHMDRWEQQ